MRALVVYESMFGNTQTIATAIAEGLSQHATVELVEVGLAPAAIGGDVGLLLVGGPTHALGLTRPSTRRDAADQSAQPVVSARIGVREWLEQAPAPATATAAATFGTKIDKPWVPGSAARSAEKRLRKLGFRITAPAEDFAVTGVSGPLRDGEAERAREWGATLGAGLMAAGRVR